NNLLCICGCGLVLCLFLYGSFERGRQMLKAQSIHKRYGMTSVLNDVSFQVKSGEIVGLVGENGAGKSTLFHIIATLQKATSGSVFLQDIANKYKLKTVR